MSLHLNAPDTLHDIHAVVDTLYRFAAGIDLRDRKLLSSAFTEDAISDFRPAGAKTGFEYPVLQGRETIVGAVHFAQRARYLPLVQQPEGGGGR